MILEKKAEVYDLMREVQLMEAQIKAHQAKINKLAEDIAALEKEDAKREGGAQPTDD